jgi:hypothetical protein
MTCYSRLVQAILVSTRFFPLVVCAFMRPQSNDELRAYFDEMTQLYRGGKPFVTLSMLAAFRSSRTAIAMAARWFHEESDAMRATCLGTAIVSPSMKFRFFFRQLLMLTPMPYPYDVVGTLPEGVEFCRKHAQGAGLLLPDEMPEVADLARALGIRSAA